MKHALMVLILFFAACSKSTPQGQSDGDDNSDPDPKPDPAKIYAYDADGNNLGTVETYNEEYAQVRTSKGFLDFLKYDGFPFAVGDEGDSVSPSQQDWIFYIFTTGREYLVWPQGKTSEKMTLVFNHSATPKNIYRTCQQSDTPEHVEIGTTIYFYQKMVKENYAMLNRNFEANDTKDTYIKYKEGRLTSDNVTGYLLSATGCKTNEEIGYPPAVDDYFALKGPITLKKGDGTIVDPSAISNSRISDLF